VIARPTGLAEATIPSFGATPVACLGVNRRDRVDDP
jgi:hypothetical protein